MKFINTIFFIVFCGGITSNIVGMQSKKQLPSTDEKIQELITATIHSQDMKIQELLEEEVNINQYIQQSKVKTYRKITNHIPKDTTINSFAIATMMFALLPIAQKDNFHLFLTKNPTINAQSSTGYTALMFASLFPSGIDAVKSLLEHGADPNIQNNKGNTALHLATLKEYNDIVELLIKAGADKEIQNKNGETPQYLAQISGNNQLVEIYKNTVSEKPAPSSEKNLIKNLSNLTNNLTILSTTLR